MKSRKYLAASVLCLTLFATAVSGQEGPTAEQLRSEAFALIAGTAADKVKAVDLLQQAAEAGDATAMAFLGGLYLSGDGVDVDREAAIAWYLKAAQAGHPAALAKLAELATEDASVAPAPAPVTTKTKTKSTPEPAAPAPDLSPADEPATASPPPAAADDGGLQAAIALVESGDPRKAFEAVPIFRKLSEAGNAEATYYLGAAYASGSGVLENGVYAMELYEQAVAAGYSAARNGIAQLYWTGTGVPQDRDRAIEIYTEQADQGDMTAAGFLTSVYSYALNGSRDIDKALQYAAIGADRNDPESFSRSGGVYANILDDNEQALALFQKALDAGDASVTSMMGIMLGYQQDPELRARGIAVLERGVAAGDAGAMSTLGRLYAEDMMAPDLEKGLPLLEQAAEIGGGYYMANLGDFYSADLYTPRDPEQAALWYRRAIWAGGVYASTYDELAKLQDSGEIVVPAADVLSTPEQQRLGAALMRQADINLRNSDLATQAKGLNDLYYAAHLGDAEAMERLGTFYYTATNLPSDLDLGLQWIRRAADAGRVESMVMLSSVLSDPVIATRWASYAAKGDLPSAWVSYGVRLLQGIGTEADTDKALELFRKGETYGEATAMTALADVFNGGFDVEADPAAAGSYLYQGIIRGDVQNTRFLIDKPNTFYTKAVREELQRQLKAGGFYTGGIDGDLGPGSRTAIEAAFDTWTP